MSLFSRIVNLIKRQHKTQLNKIINDHNEKLTQKMKIPTQENKLINNKEYMIKLLMKLL